MAALESVEDEAVRVGSLGSVGSSLVMGGRINEALALSEGAFEPALRLQHVLPAAPVWAVSSRCTALFFAGRADESLELVDLAMEAVPQVPLQVAARAGAYRGRILLFQGRAGSASRRLTDAALSVRANQGVYPSWCLALAAESHALLGHHEEAREAATEAVILDRSEIQAYRPDRLRAWPGSTPKVAASRLPPTNCGRPRISRFAGPTQLRDHHPRRSAPSGRTRSGWTHPGAGGARRRSVVGGHRFPC